MLKFRLNIYWKICWMGVTPALIVLTILVASIGYSPLTYAEYTYPPWAEFMGASMVILALLPIPGYMVYFLHWKSKGDTFKEVCITFLSLPLNKYLENKRRQFWFCCHMLSGNGQARPLFEVVDAGLAGIHYDWIA